nr:hypothetical protein [Tanacetum cinerariifolium]
MIKFPQLISQCDLKSKEKAHSHEDEYLGEVKDACTRWLGEPQLIEAFYKFLMMMKRIKFTLEKRNVDPRLRNRCREEVPPLRAAHTKPPTTQLALPSTPFNKTATIVNTPQKRRLSQKEYEEKRSKNLCFYCDQKYVPCHTCSGLLFSIEFLADDEVQKSMEEVEECLEEEVIEKPVVYPHISLNALAGVNDFHTMRIEGHEGKHDIHILDKTLMMCIDYRQLNKPTIKDKFFILVIEELIDELTGAQVKYLGHVISAKGVTTDPSKIAAMKDWPIPKSIKELRGFLGLTGYYRRFIKGLATISQPLTILLKNNAFKWSDAAQEVFEELKQAMIQTQVLALLIFKAEFMVENDASRVGLGAIMQQYGHPIAYLNKTLAPKHQSLSTYEKELMVLVLALGK